MSETNWDGIMKALICGCVLVTSNGKVIDYNALKEDTDMIAGYRELDSIELAAINELKALETTVLARLLALRNQCNHDNRWLAMARTHFEQGFMAAIRAIAKPETVEF